MIASPAVFIGWRAVQRHHGCNARGKLKLGTSDIKEPMNFAVVMRPRGAIFFTRVIQTCRPFSPGSFFWRLIYPGTYETKNHLGRPDAVAGRLLSAAGGGPSRAGTQN
jgi:hypothetical protein